MGSRRRTLLLVAPAAILLSWPAPLFADGAASFDGNAFSQPMPALDAEGQDRFRTGNLLFRKLWVAAPAAFPDSDGLGPLFNARSCQACHIRDGRGLPPSGTDLRGSGFVLRLSVQGLADPVYGRQVQTFAAPGLTPEGQVVLTHRTLSVPLRDAPPEMLDQPGYAVGALSNGPIDPATRLSPRVAPQLIGLGLLASIPEESILANADPDDSDGDGISGRANVISAATGKAQLGRFGLKAASPSLREQTAVAFSLDLGLSTDLRPAAWGDCTAAQPACQTAPHGEDADRAGGREVDGPSLDLLTFYTASLAVPPRRTPGAPLVRRGETVFAEAGCTSCHLPEFQFPPSGPGATAAIQPFTDLLLHDMGAGLADGMEEGLATGREWRTPPLWGIGLTEAVSGGTSFLHDGRARSLLEAVLWHGGEAETARERVIGLPQPDRAALIAFLESL